MKTLFTGLKEISMTAVLAASLGVGVPAISQATPIYPALKYVIGGGTPVLVYANPVGDVFVKSTSSGVSVTFQGYSRPISGTVEKPNIDLSTSNIYNGSPSTIDVDVWMTDIGFAAHANPLGLLSSFGGTLGSGGTAEFWSYASMNGTAFDTSVTPFYDSGLITVAGTFGANSYSSQLLSDPFSLTLRAHFRLKSGAGVTSSDQGINVPEPSVLGMVGLGLLMVGLMGLRFRQARYRGDHSKA